MAFWDNEDKTNAKPQSTETNKTAIKEVAGFPNLSEAQKSAPNSTSGVAVPSSTRRGSSAGVPKQPSKKEIEEQEKQAKQKAAMEAVGKHLMEKFAAIPYEAWAMLAEDQYYKLSQEDTKKLGEEYYILASSVEMDFSKPYWLVLGIMAAHAAFIGDRLKHFNEMQEEKEKRMKLQQKREQEGVGVLN